ncbi:MAG TPA: metal-dependent transcriptional regulator [Chitinophagaceae bacterium]|nr:metal-dependent transcriptional regulator [Chitinophagaceae bacterium]
MNSLTEENYLKALFNIANETGEVNVAELSKTLDIKMPTVTSMMKKLSEKKLVHYESYKPLHLTEKGKKEAGLIIRKHRLTEMFLVEKMNLGWEDVHDIAEQIEHIQSPVFFDKMDELLGYPKVDPHGSPIPDKNGKIIWKEYNKLSDCKVGETVKLAAVINTSSDFLKFLNAREMRLGLKIKIKSIEPFDRSYIVSYGKRQGETLSNLVCERLLVEKGA